MLSRSNKKAIGAYLKKNVIPDGMPVKAAADLLEVGRPALSNLINGNSRLSHEMAAKLEKAFGNDKNVLLSKQQELEEEELQKKADEISVKSYTHSVFDIRARQIEAWADKNIDARSKLAALLRRLAYSSTASITALNFPAHENSQTYGWDGYIESVNSNPWIPQGKSGWEFGCNANPKGKADSDYQARVEATDSSPEEKAETTFIFVTPRRWAQKGDWAKSKQAEGVWKDVIAFDSNDLEQWLETSASTQVWFAELIGIQTEGMQSPEHYFDSWAQVSNPPLNGVIFKGLIEAHKNEVVNWISNPGTRPLIVAASSKEEAGSFLANMFETTEELSPYLHRLVFVSRVDTLKRLDFQMSDVIVVAENSEVEIAVPAHFRDKPAIVLAEKNVPGTEPHITLDIPDLESFDAALKEMGFDEPLRSVHTNNSGMSPTILRRQLADVPSAKRPPWATSDDKLKDLIPFVLAGTWKSNQAGDREVLQMLCEMDWETIEQEVAKYTAGADVAIWSEGHFRGTVSKLEALFTVSDYVTRKQLDDFLIAAELVLSEDDPALDLPEDQQWCANIYNKVRDHSGAIRDGICDTLILLAVHGNRLFGGRLGTDVEQSVSKLIISLLEKKDSRTWEAQVEKLPRYAEAAPNIFLEIVEAEMRSTEPALLPLFRSVETGMFSRCPRTGMLWALELLAWDAALLSRVCLILAKLAELEISDNWSNTPENSLKEILLSWRPHTSANLEQRKAVLELIFARHPSVGWKFCYRELSFGNDFSSPTSRPRWRADATYASRIISQAEAIEFKILCMNLLLRDQLETADQVSDLLDCLHQFPDKEIEKVIDRIKEWIKSNPTEEVISELRDKVRQNYKFLKRRADKKDQRDLSHFVKQIYDLLQPSSILYQYHWLFAKHWVEWSRDELEADEKGLGYSDREKRIESARLEAIQHIHEELGNEGLINLCKSGEAGFPIGFIICDQAFTMSELTLFVLGDLLQADNVHHLSIRECLSGALFKSFHKYGVTYFEELLDEIGSEKLRAHFLLHSPKTMELWHLLEKEKDEVQAEYWKNVIPRCLDQSSDELEYFIQKLMAVGRPKSAFSIAHLYSDQVSSTILIDLLRKVASTPVADNDNYSLREYEVTSCLEVLNERSDVSQLERAQIEFIYIELFRHGSKYKIPNLSAELATSPLLFVQMIAHCFKRSDSGVDPQEWNIPTNEDERSIVARKSYQLLDSLSTIPGSDNDGEINPDQLFSWAVKVREIAAEQARLEITDKQIGQLLAKCGLGSDGIWPHESVREVFDKISSVDISTGMEVGIHNSRGAHWRGPDGAQERGLAEKYLKFAEALSSRYPFVGQMLMNISNSYQRQAEWEDSEGRIRKRILE